VGGQRLHRIIDALGSVMGRGTTPMYDYVIVGAGSAGCVLAARLTEDPEVNVLLLEAGPPDAIENIHVPAAAAQLLHSQVDWGYSTIPEPHADNRRIHLPRGKALGGSSSINWMVYIRGHRADYDGWRDDGCHGWGYDDLLPYFKRAEDNERGASEYHGTGGPLTVSDGRSLNPMTEAFLIACDQDGRQRNDDFNGAEQDGFGRYQVTQRGGRRCSTAVAYLHPATARPNLTVETFTQVHRVLLEEGRAVGVRASRAGELGEPHEFCAEREVILSGGAYGSPRLLMLSGVGPAEHLTTLGIPVVADLPTVGQNLQDHAGSGLLWTHDQPVSLLSAASEENLAIFAAEGRGPLTSNYGEAGGFLRSREHLPAPDLQFHALPLVPLEEPIQEHGFTLAVCALKPASRGTLTLRSADPTIAPFILHNYYSEDSDMCTMLEGMRIAAEIGARPALASYTSRLHVQPASDSEDDLRAYLRQHTYTVFHPVGTCRMGSDDDAVVDVELRVRGVEGLRVVDASVMPSVTRGNTNAPTIAIAERAADLIRHGVATLAPQAITATAATRT
jgi:choline dehydrogenase